MLQEQITSDIKAAMKSGDQFALGILRMVASALQNRAIEKRGAGEDSVLTDDEVRAVLAKEAKRRKDAAVMYREGNRSDLAEQEEREAVFIATYLPAQMGAEDVENHVKRVVATLRQAQGDIAFGTIMKEVMKELKGKADGKIVGEVIKRVLE